MPEIDQELSKFSRRDVSVVFVPHLLPMIRGIHATLYATALDVSKLPDLQALYDTLEQRDLAAGSPLARRLFS